MKPLGSEDLFGHRVELPLQCHAAGMREPDAHTSNATPQRNESRTGGGMNRSREG